MGVILAEGQDQLKGKAIRIAHVGYMGAFDVITAIAARNGAKKIRRRDPSAAASLRPGSADGGFELVREILVTELWLPEGLEVFQRAPLRSRRSYRPQTR